MIYKDQLTISDERFSIVIMNVKNEIEKKGFLQSFYISFGCRYNFNLEWFTWFYVNNPLGKCYNYLLLNSNKNIIGAFGYSRTLCVLKGLKIEALIGINGFVNPSHSGKGLFSQMINSSVKDIETKCELMFSFPHGANLASIKGHIKGGWREFKKIYFYVKNLNAFSPESTCENVYLGNVDLLIDYNFSLNQSDVFQKSYYSLYWRFERRPDKVYKTLILRADDSDIKGYVIYTLYEKEKQTRCQIADYHIQSKYDFSKLLESLAIVAKESGCSTLECLVNEEHSNTEILKKENFLKSDEHYVMFVQGKKAEQLPPCMKVEYGSFDVV